MNTEPETFAVDLSNDGIFLWHRKLGQKWEFLGSVPLDSGNLRQQLENLKTIAEAINAPSHDAVVRIPTSEVHTLTVTNDPKSDTSWEQRIVSALETAAKAPIKTLAFDIDRGDGTSDISVAWTQIAVIEQAETFVHLIGFTPTRYTTDVNAADFPRNPNFKITKPVENTVIPDTAQNGLASEPAPVAAIIELETEIEATTPKDVKPVKSGFDFFWFIALTLILTLIIAAILYWPGFKQYWPNA
ncbi:MAG: hypothetical protein JKX71_00335 [Amylibacter sp.]|nr:hypothetical protein [Amylibacter sp.]